MELAVWGAILASIKHSLGKTGLAVLRLVVLSRDLWADNDGEPLLLYKELPLRKIFVCTSTAGLRSPGPEDFSEFREKLICT